MVRDKCSKKLNATGVVSFQCHVMCFEVVAFVCPATRADCITCFVWEEHMSCPCPGLSNFPAAGIFAAMHYACMCLPGTAAMLSQPPPASLHSLSLPAPLKKRMGEDRRGADLWGLSRDMDLQHISNKEELVCFLPFFYTCRFGEIQGILKRPTMFLMLPSKHKNVFIPITPLLFSIQGLQFQDSLNYCAKVLIPE